MTTVDFITDLFCRIDDQMPGVPKHSQAKLWPSEVITLGILHALKGVGNRAFYRWLIRDYQTLFPNLPERTRLFRAFKTHRAWTYGFLAAVSKTMVNYSHGRWPNSVANGSRAGIAPASTERVSTRLPPLGSRREGAAFAGRYCAASAACNAVATPRQNDQTGFADFLTLDYRVFSA